MKALLTALATATLAFASFCSAAELPARKPGLWEVRVSQENMPGEHVTKQCIDEKTDAQMQEMGASLGSQMGGGACGKPDIRKDGGTYIVEGSCRVMGTEIKSKAVLKGDFHTAYEGTSEATYSPPMMGVSGSTTRISARWTGPCAAGQLPGDIIMPNGMKMNMGAMQQMGQMMKGR